MNQMKPAPDQQYFEGFIQGLKVALSIARAHNQNERGKFVRKMQREQNQSIIPHNSKLG